MEKRGTKRKSCKDMGCKLEVGFNGSDIMRSKKQKRKLEANDKKRGWESGEKDVQPPAKRSKGDELIAGLPRINIDGVEFIDMEAFFKSGQSYTPSGRAVYIPPALVPIREFYPVNDTPENPSFISYGKRRTGKTFFMRWWMWHFKVWVELPKTGRFGVASDKPAAGIVCKKGLTHTVPGLL